MNQEELKEQVKKLLEELGAQGIEFPNTEPHRVIARFNWKNVVSFKASLPGWEYSGIQLDPTREKEYQIEFLAEKTISTP